MSNWRDQILAEFTPKCSRLTLVADPDGLLLEEGILEGIRARGFELIPFEDQIAFRYAYESQYRSRWDKGEETALVVVLRSQESDLSSLPYDLLKTGRKLSFSLAEIFHNFSSPVVEALDRGDLDTLYEAQTKQAPEHLGENSSKDFILRHVFELAPELIKQPSDLLRVLLRRHYQAQRIPKILDERFLQLLRQENRFEGWPLETLIADRELFFAFLQERWPVFLDSEAAKLAGATAEHANTYSLRLGGPQNLPFEHPDIRVYLDNLFLEGFLRPVPHSKAQQLSKTWGIGLQITPAEDSARRLKELFQTLASALPTAEAKHTEWLQFARKWAELGLLLNEHPEKVSPETKDQVKKIQSQLDTVFSAWLLKRYSGLVNLPPLPPAMLHHLPRFMAGQRETTNNKKIALVVVDGLALDQWLVIQTELSLQQPNFLFREQAVFAWLPSLTSISRQALFAGKAPLFFPDSLRTTNKEPALWTQFWGAQGVPPEQVVYLKNLGDGDLGPVAEELSKPKVQIVGLVVDKVDRIMHGMELGTAGMHNQVRQWAKQSYFKDLLNLLLDNGFRVYLTSDHGNVEAEGCGTPTEGAVADLRGERVRLYPDVNLRRRIKDKFATATEWPPLGLPEDCLPLLAPARQAFIQTGKHTVGHGGDSIEELIVPLVQIERRP